MEKRTYIEMKSTKETKNVYMRESTNGIYVRVTGGNDISFIIPQNIVSEFVRMSDTIEFDLGADQEYGAGAKNINLNFKIDINNYSGCMTIGVMTDDGGINAYTIDHDYLLELFNLAKRAEMMGKLFDLAKKF